MRRLYVAVLALLLLDGCNLVLGNERPNAQSIGGDGGNANAGQSNGASLDNGAGGSVVDDALGGRSTAGDGLGLGGMSGVGGALGEPGASDVGVAGTGGEGGAEPIGCEPNDDRLCSEVYVTVQGNCALGHTTCTAERMWLPCDVVPAASDSCDALGDDATCDGTPNGDCPCVNGTMQPCGPDTDEGACEIGTSTCVNEEWGPCNGALYPAERDCASGDDLDCDGTPDDTIDDDCRCHPGERKDCDEHPEDGVGVCTAGETICVSDSGTSDWDTCEGAVGPGVELCNDNDDDENCDNQVNEDCTCLTGEPENCGNCDGGTKICDNGVFGDCVDQPGSPVIYYRDQDGDAYGNPNVTTVSCTGAPDGYVSDNTDCCDTDADARPGQTAYFASQREGDGSAHCNTGGAYDYNCDGQQTGSIEVASCADQNAPCATANCTPGWENSAPGCPGTGDYHSWVNRCDLEGGMIVCDCVPTTTVQEGQECR